MTNHKEDSTQPILPPDIALWRPSLITLLLAGIAAGGILGAANGVFAHYVTDAFETELTAAMWGFGLGMLGGVVVVLFRRAVWGPDIGVEVGTQLGLIYGMLPGAGILFESFIVHRVIYASWYFVGVVMAASMMGLMLGGLLDRLTEMVIVWRKR